MKNRRGRTTTQVADYLGVDTGKVHKLIKTGQLRAIDVSAGATRPRYRILEADLQAFVEQRLVAPEPPTPRRRRRKPVNVKQFY